MKHAGVSLLVLSLLVLVSCYNRRMEFSVQPPPSHPFQKGLGYAVITDSYIPVKDIPGDSGIVLGYYRKGMIVPISERKSVKARDGHTEFWLKNDGPQNGWIKQIQVQIYDNEEQAKTATQTIEK